MIAKKRSVTIGIPAFNEEENIVNLIKALLNQKLDKYVLEKIIVVDDGSTDNTVKAVNSIKNKKVSLFRHNKRQGIGVTQNKILKNSQSDFLILLDADVLPKGTKFIQELLYLFDKNENLGLVGGSTVALQPGNIFESIISHGHTLKNYMYSQINNGNNLYLCHGRVRAFTKKFYTKLRWETGASEDAYSYLKCISMGFSFLYTPKAKVIFRCPQNYKDHVNQSKRFFASPARLSSYFDRKMIDTEYRIPINALFKGFVFGLTNKPHLTVLYGLLVLYVKFFSKVNIHDVFWVQASSSKSLTSSYNN
jgi:glycosyltransferase involved in cell wall biosynthesis